MISQAQLNELEAAHKRIAHIVGKGEAWEIVLRKPTRAEYKQFRSKTHNPSQVADAQEILVRQIVVYPNRETFDALLEDYPGSPESCGPTLQDLVGMTADEQGK